MLSRAFLFAPTDGVSYQYNQTTYDSMVKSENAHPKCYAMLPCLPKMQYTCESCHHRHQQKNSTRNEPNADQTPALSTFRQIQTSFLPLLKHTHITKEERKKKRKKRKQIKKKRDFATCDHINTSPISPEGSKSPPRPPAISSATIFRRRSGMSLAP